MKYLRRELNQVEKKYLKQFGQDSLNRVVLHDPNTKDKQEVQDTIDILKEAIAKNKPLEQVPEDMPPFANALSLEKNTNIQATMSFKTDYRISALYCQKNGLSNLLQVMNSLTK